MFTKSLSNILSTFTRTLRDLEELEEDNRQEITTKECKVETLTKEVSTLKIENNQVTKIKTKITELIT